MTNWSQASKNAAAKAEREGKKLPPITPRPVPQVMELTEREMMIIWNASQDLQAFLESDAGDQARELLRVTGKEIVILTSKEMDLEITYFLDHTGLKQTCPVSLIVPDPIEPSLLMMACHFKGKPAQTVLPWLKVELDKIADAVMDKNVEETKK